MRFAWGLATDVGRVRAANEDNALATDGLFVVADGMGGHRGGATASGLTVERMAASAPLRSTQRLVEVVREANAEIMRQAASDPELDGMGTTVCALAAVESDGRELLALANVGDSRVYVHTPAGLQQLTLDHSLVAQLVREGSLTAEEAEHHPRRNILTRALGIDPNLVVDHWELEPVVGDRYVLCSDGLFGELRDDQIAAVLRRLADPKEAAAELVRLANAAGGRDNVTVVVVDVVDAAAPAARPTDTVRATREVDTTPGTVDGPPLIPPGYSSDGADDDAPTGAATTVRDAPPVAAATRGRARDAGHARDEVRVQPPRVFTWRVGVFLLALLAVVLGGIGAILWLGRNNYVVAFDDDDRVVILQGRLPDGVLWVKPTLEKGDTGLDRSTVPRALHAELERGHDEPSLRDAEAYVERIKEAARATASPSTTTTPPTLATTTTTLPAAVPTAVAPTTGLEPASAGSR